MPLTRCARGISKNGQRELFSTAASKIQYRTVQGILFVIYVPRTCKTSYPKCPNRGKCFQPFHPAIFLLRKTGVIRPWCSSSLGHRCSDGHNYCCASHSRGACSCCTSASRPAHSLCPLVSGQGCWGCRLRAATADHECKQGNTEKGSHRIQLLISAHISTHDHSPCL